MADNHFKKGTSFGCPVPAYGAYLLRVSRDGAQLLRCVGMSNRREPALELLWTMTALMWWQIAYRVQQDFNARLEIAGEEPAAMPRGGSMWLHREFGRELEIVFSLADWSAYLGRTSAEVLERVDDFLAMPAARRMLVTHLPLHDDDDWHRWMYAVEEAIVFEGQRQINGLAEIGITPDAFYEMGEGVRDILSNHPRANLPVIRRSRARALAQRAAA